MGPGKRQTGERRLGMPVAFPLTDNEGRHALRDRRDGVDRRKSVAALDELLILLSQLSSEDPERKQ